jgi:hypothetical protein
VSLWPLNSIVIPASLAPSLPHSLNKHSWMFAVLGAKGARFVEGEMQHGLKPGLEILVWSTSDPSL